MGNQAALPSERGKISLHILVDRAVVDIYGGNGTLSRPMAKALVPENQSLKLFCQGGKARIVLLTVYGLQSAS